MHETGLQRFFERFAIHPGKHENPTDRNLTVRGLLDDCRDKTIGGKFEIEFHCCRIADCRIIGNVV